MEMLHFAGYLVPVGTSRPNLGSCIPVPASSNEGTVIPQPAGATLAIAVLKAEPLMPGGTVALVSTSSPVDEDYVDRVVSFFVAEGYRAWKAPGLTEGRGHLAGSAEQRARGLNMALSDPCVGLVLPVTGGRGAKQLLPLVDYAAATRSRCLFIGLSDPLGARQYHRFPLRFGNVAWPDGLRLLGRRGGSFHVRMVLAGSPG